MCTSMPRDFQPRWPSVAGILSGDEDGGCGTRCLQGGCSLPPIDLLKLCGVDMSTTKPVDEALKVFGELLEEFCRL